eukprot:1159898-Pelagomonas_calceolata.AAC.1
MKKVIHNFKGEEAHCHECMEIGRQDSKLVWAPLPVMPLGLNSKVVKSGKAFGQGSGLNPGCPFACTLNSRVKQIWCPGAACCQKPTRPTLTPTPLETHTYLQKEKPRTQLEHSLHQLRKTNWLEGAGSSLHHIAGSKRASGDLEGCWKHLTPELGCEECSCF